MNRTSHAGGYAVDPESAPTAPTAVGEVPGSAATAAHLGILTPDLDTPFFTIWADDGLTPLAKLHRDGALWLAEGFTPNEAAVRFWDSLRGYAAANPLVIP